MSMQPLNRLQMAWRVAQDVHDGMLVNLGYDPEQVSNLKMDYRFRKSDEDGSRKAHDSSYQRQGKKRVASQEQVTWHRTWTWLQPDDFEDAGFTEEEFQRKRKEIIEAL